MIFVLNKDINTVLFDMDGTLCRYEKGFTTTFVEMLEEEEDLTLSFDTSKLEDAYEERFVVAMNQVKDQSDRAKFITEAIKNGREGKNGHNEEQLLSFAEKFAATRRSQLTLYDKAEAVVQNLRENFNLGLLTNGPSGIQWGKIDILGIEEWFEEIIVSGDYGVAKPDPKIFNIALEKLGAEKNNSVYIGNSLKHDITGADRAGITSIWIDRGEEYESEWETDPDYTIKNLEEILELPLFSGKTIR